MYLLTFEITKNWILQLGRQYHLTYSSELYSTHQLEVFLDQSGTAVEIWIWPES